jgi:predicted permease
MTSRAASFTSMLEGTRSIPATAPLDATDIAAPCVQGGPLLPVCSNHDQPYSYHQPATPAPSIHKKPFRRRLLTILKSFIMPVTIATLLGISCSVILPLKALFTYTEGWTGGRMPDAPDGNPPLAFILETAAFLGAMTVPAALILLGASFARLKVSRLGILRRY